MPIWPEAAAVPVLGQKGYEKIFKHTDLKLTARLATVGADPPAGVARPAGQQRERHTYNQGNLAAAQRYSVTRAWRRAQLRCSYRGLHKPARWRNVGHGLQHDPLAALGLRRPRHAGAGQLHLQLRDRLLQRLHGENSWQREQRCRTTRQRRVVRWCTACRTLPAVHHTLEQALALHFSCAPTCHAPRPCLLPPQNVLSPQWCTLYVDPRPGAPPMSPAVAGSPARARERGGWMLRCVCTAALGSAPRPARPCSKPAHRSEWTCARCEWALRIAEQAPTSPRRTARARSRQRNDRRRVDRRRRRHGQRRRVRRRRGRIHAGQGGAGRDCNWGAGPAAFRDLLLLLPRPPLLRAARRRRRARRRLAAAAPQVGAAPQHRR